MQSYVVAPSVRWIVERRGLLLLNGDQSCLNVCYPEAAIWDLMSRGYSFSVIMNMLVPITRLETPEIMRLFDEALNTWIAEGYLIVGKSDG